MRVFHKLIRDRIPEIIARDGQRPKVRVLDKEEFREALERKLLEEVQELRETQAPDHKREEVADIYEVLEALAEEHGFSREEIAELQRRKRQERGSFAKRLFLESVE